MWWCANPTVVCVCTAYCPRIFSPLQMCNIPRLSAQLDLLLSLRELPTGMNDLQPVSFLHHQHNVQPKVQIRCFDHCLQAREVKTKPFSETRNMHFRSIMQILMWKHAVALDVNEKTIWGQTGIDRWKPFGFQSELYVWIGFHSVCWPVKRHGNREAWKAL